MHAPLIFVNFTSVCRSESPQGLMFVSYAYSTFNKYSILLEICSGVRRRRPSFVHNVKMSSLNGVANQRHILCGSSMGEGNESLFAASWSYGQDYRHAHIWQSPSKIFFTGNSGPISTKLGM